MLAQAKRRAKRPAQKRRLTELFVRKTKPRDSEYLVWDTARADIRIRCFALLHNSVRATADEKDPRLARHQ